MHKVDHPRSRGVYWCRSRPVTRCVGIIPARAGFTEFAAWMMGIDPDHPRSRGVYHGVRQSVTVDAGSSPLARGLRTRARTPWRVPRIIPARAGFTLVAVVSAVWNGDHPRSRGVYWNAIWGAVSGFGSSPLARGLPGRTKMILGVRRIIPARAGFTAFEASADGKGTDHPRSRGVYRSSHAPEPFWAGSSPLARGLPLVYRQSTYWERIIPARAGFTEGLVRLRGPPQDHPRSRGVYPRWRGAASLTAGSSPLARGLPVLAGIQSVDFGIIPARAGFTVVEGVGFHGVGDHPRSRGVYASGFPSGAGLTGSSPLARGLRRGRVATLLADGIIPAHAGFTRSPRRTITAAGDHPRSRGVYAAYRSGLCVLVGSSPLARGLPAPRGMASPPGRIIPARAGFTRISGEGAGDLRDHPRSRGVYSLLAPMRRLRRGSSPLARGLRVRAVHEDRGGRIIPARAGFTGARGP